MSRILLAVMFGMIALSCCTTAQRVGHKASTEQDKISCDTAFVSPSGNYKVCVDQPDTKTIHGFSTIFIIRNTDEAVLLREQVYLGQVGWISDSIAHITLRPEVKKYNTNSVQEFYFNVLQQKKVLLKDEL